MTTEINTHNLICDFGKHKGQPYTRLPVNYLQWMVNTNHNLLDIAKAELERRGTVMPEIDISGHAIDRCSTHAYKFYRLNRLNSEEGIHAFLCRISKEAIKNNIKDQKGRFIFYNIRLAIEQDGCWPVLVTVIKVSKQRGEKNEMGKA